MADTWTISPEMQGQIGAGADVRAVRSKDSGGGNATGRIPLDRWRRALGADQPARTAGRSTRWSRWRVDPANPDVIYAGTWHLPWRTTDGGKTWTNIKQGIIDDSDVFSIIIDPKLPKVVYLSACSGIYKSEDGGAKFTGGVSVNKVQGIPVTARRTRVLNQDPNNLDTVYAGTTEGLYRTLNAGKYWMRTTGPDVIMNDVYVDPTNSKRVLLATDRRGVLASDDGGDSFASSNNGISERQVTALLPDAKHPETMYAGVVNDKSYGGVFVTEDGGKSWIQRSSGLDGRLGFQPGADG